MCKMDAKKAVYDNLAYDFIRFLLLSELINIIYNQFLTC